MPVKVISKGLRSEEDEKMHHGFSLSFGQLLKTGSVEHKQAIAEAQKHDPKAAKALLAKLPSKDQKVQ